MAACFFVIYVLAVDRLMGVFARSGCTFVRAPARACEKAICQGGENAPQHLQSYYWPAGQTRLGAG